MVENESTNNKRPTNKTVRSSFKLLGLCFIQIIIFFLYSTFSTDHLLFLFNNIKNMHQIWLRTFLFYEFSPMNCHFSHWSVNPQL